MTGYCQEQNVFAEHTQAAYHLKLTAVTHVKIVAVTVCHRTLISEGSKDSCHGEGQFSVWTHFETLMSKPFVSVIQKGKRKR